MGGPRGSNITLYSRLEVRGRMSSRSEALGEELPLGLEMGEGGERTREDGLRKDAGRG